MKDAPAPMHGGRGPELLLAHCSALALPEGHRPPAFWRLEQAVGGELAHLLVIALAGRHRRAQLAA
jgi:hypothetical protein